MNTELWNCCPAAALPLLLVLLYSPPAPRSNDGRPVPWPNEGGFLVASSGAGGAGASALFFFLEAEAGDDGVESELNQTPMDLNRDLALPLLLPAGSCCDHKGLGPADRRPGLPADDDDTFLRWSRPAMSPHLQTHHSKQSTTNGR